MTENFPKSNVLYVGTREYVLHDAFTLRINPEGQAETPSAAHLFENAVPQLRMLDKAYELIRSDAQQLANRGRYRGVPMEMFEVRVKQHFLQQDPRAAVDWWFELGLFMVGGEEVEIDETTDYSELGGEAT